MEINEAYDKLKEIAEKQIIELAKRGSMSPAEAEAAKVGMCLIDMVDEKKEDMEEMEGGYSERGSRRSYSPRRYSITSYEDGRSMRGSRNSMHYPMYDDYYDYMEDSYRGGGQSNRGSYEGRGGQSNRSYENQNRDRRGRYSSHSIDDRIVSHLERMMDETESDYERQRLQEYMRYVRAQEMSE